MSYHTAIVTATLTNTDFRRVLFTGTSSQLVVMAIPPGEDIGEETHEHVEQTLFFLRGTARVVLNGQETPMKSGDVVVVSPGTRHNVINTGTEPLKIYTVYAPPNHLEGRVHRTKADAAADTEDEAFGHRAT